MFEKNISSVMAGVFAMTIIAQSTAVAQSSSNKQSLAIAAFASMKHDWDSDRNKNNEYSGNGPFSGLELTLALGQFAVGGGVCYLGGRMMWSSTWKGGSAELGAIGVVLYMAGMLAAAHGAAVAKAQIQRYLHSTETGKRGILDGLLEEMKYTTAFQQNTFVEGFIKNPLRLLNIPKDVMERALKRSDSDGLASLVLGIQKAYYEHLMKNGKMACTDPAGITDRPDNTLEKGRDTDSISDHAIQAPIIAL